MAFRLPWDEEKYKRHPAGAAQSLGGQFAPKNLPKGRKGRKPAGPPDLAPYWRYAATDGEVNRVLRGVEPMTPDVQKIIAAMDAMLAGQRMPVSVVAFREMTPEVNAAIDDLQPGDVIVDQGYASVTASPLSVHHVMEQHVEAGAHTGKVTAYKVLIPRGALALPVVGPTRKGTRRRRRRDDENLHHGPGIRAGRQALARAGTALRRRGRGNPRAGRVAEAVPPEPMIWDDLSGATQEGIEEAYKKDKFDSALESEHQSYFESGQALGDAKFDLASKFIKVKFHHSPTGIVSKYSGGGGDYEWAADAIAEYREDRAEEGLPAIRYTDEQLLAAIDLDYANDSGDGRDDPKTTRRLIDALSRG